MIVDYIKRILFVFMNRADDQSSPAPTPSPETTTTTIEMTTAIAEENNAENILYAIVENCLKDNVSIKCIL